MSRPHRHTPKRQDPNFLVMHPSSRIAENDLKADKAEIIDASSDVAKLSVSDVSDEISKRVVSNEVDNSTICPEPELPCADSRSLGEGSRSVTPKPVRKQRKSAGCRRVDGEDSDNVAVHVRKCEKAGCPAKRPVCFVGLSEKCAKNGYTSRWYHISSGEHFCNECFDYCYRTNHEGHDLYMRWKERWDAGAKGEGGLKRFMVDLFLPYWLACSRCGKWRQVPRTVDVTYEFIRTFWCGTSHATKKVPVDPNACSVEQDERATLALDHNWLRSVTIAPLLLRSPAIPFLAGYHADTVGHSPSAAHDTVLLPADSQPFCTKDKPLLAGMVQPNLMTEEECSRMTNYSSDVNFHPCYLGLRNAIIAQWHWNCKERVSAEGVACRLLCRGLMRLRYVADLPYIIYYLTCKGLINTGVFPSPSDSILPVDSSPDDNTWDAIVVGAGIAGLGAARHMRDACGFKVLVLEGRSSAGGRLVCIDDKQSGQCIGGRLLHGTINNPVAMLCKQCDVPPQVMSTECPLVSEQSGHVISVDADQRMDFHLNHLLDSVEEWQKNDNSEPDVSLLEKFLQFRQQFTKESGSAFSAEEEAVLQFHFAQFEFACGGSLGAVSARQWDHNEDIPQYDGPSCLLTASDCERIVTLLSTDLCIEYNADVTTINYSGESVTVAVRDGRTFVGDSVVVTLPLGVLKADCVNFMPPLPSEKLDAIRQLGAGHAEQITLRFSKRFWLLGNDCSGIACFGRVASQTEDRAKFSVFYDVTPPMSAGDGGEALSPTFTLMTFLCGNSVNSVYEDKLDAAAVVAECVSVLRKMFPLQQVPEPLSWHVSDWKHDPYSRMAFSYMPVGCTSASYSTIAAPLDNKVFFAGEATNRNLPQSVTGAYTSGLRAAEEILMLSTFD